MTHCRNQIAEIVVTAAEMRAIENRLFAAGMPVAALMEKVAGLVARRMMAQWKALGLAPTKIGVLVGPGHNGGDALVIARELYLQGYSVVVTQPLANLKELTQAHAEYGKSLDIPWVSLDELLASCEILIDGLFGFGLERSISGELAEQIDRINQSQILICSIDLPSGIHTDTGQVLGCAIRADYTFCLGLWKAACLQDAAVEYLGTVEWIDFGIPFADIDAILGQSSRCYRITREGAIAGLPLPRPLLSHKYKAGHLLLVCGSEEYAGSAILTGLGARASGVGMLSIAVPHRLKPLLVAQLPEALIIPCPETETGAIAELPDTLNYQKYQAIACGPGITRSAEPLIPTLLNLPIPAILDADGLNILASLGMSQLNQRSAPTILTPHTGEFKRLFPNIDPNIDRIKAVRAASQETGAIVLLKGARTAIGSPTGTVYLNPESTPALARGGSGDVLTGLLGGLVAQLPQAPEMATQTATWWHAQAGILAAQQRTALGVDAFHLTEYLSQIPLR
ncbi:MAG: NAD(P)H-hydrate dehydratase [Roseofilum sp. SBFL]|uniref:NAD(P)H-hydrate dehydratase n=1 Tax=unclassified Roseofilum TaxID=2620099 RepID=UPI001AFFF965|nr:MULTISPECIES: NAD(P)H-hydrate dehydratase [unclassified Roseofilum]MBP0014525.1 NAD(P)H-hydrate dehydratase [Roseofilum sp. SID3]MBP0024390.1 NAD(P)H-hydrate dehydratase [Roseofilum sp. SID2]MBP0037762.1 NAD(P)H-hydrate dehydratase [Roseofilum sp. SID1]MBP0040570.1 NAD(P)H-hydrate dehydratase [Roseofilum sp. SBFL]